MELQDINPPANIRDAMEKQMRAERDKRATVLEAEGKKQAQILEAEGKKQAQITEAEGQKGAAVLRASGEQQAIELVADALKGVGTDPAQYLIALKYIDAFSNIVRQGDKTVMIPMEATAPLGSLAGIKGLFDVSLPDARKAPSTPK